MTLVDSNVLIDLVTDDPIWAAWSQERLEEADREGPVIINDIVYAEVSTSFSTFVAFEAMLERARLSTAPIPARRSFSLEKLSRPTVGAAASAPASCPISSLAPMRHSGAGRC